MQSHFKCRNEPYRGGHERAEVAEENVSWDVLWTDYAPKAYTAESIKGQPWADPDLDGKVELKWNDMDDKYKVDRRTHTAHTHSLTHKLTHMYEVDEKGRPINPVGRTGMTGRGCLGRWGPNHAADPIVTRWKPNDAGVVDADPPSPKKKVLQFIAIRRRDLGEWAIPGGMVDPGEMVTTTLRREFGEEALNSLEANDSDREAIENSIEELFHHGKEIYRGYVDDPRNTDNAWMETVAYNFHDEHGTSVGKFRLHAGDDAVGVQWMDIDRNVKLYASHAHMIKEVVDRLNAHW